jgi:hypothetical protein
MVKVSFDEQNDRMETFGVASRVESPSPPFQPLKVSTLSSIMRMRMSKRVAHPLGDHSGVKESRHDLWPAAPTGTFELAAKPRGVASGPTALVAAGRICAANHGDVNLPLY